MISNETKDVEANAAVALASNDEWRTARITGRRAFGRDYPTNGVVAHGTLFVMSSGLQELIAGAPEERERLRNVAVIRAVGEVGPLRLYSPTRDENAGPSVEGREPAQEQAK